MDYEFESIIPWNGEHDTGRDARLKLDRNFAKIKSNFEELAGSRYVTTNFFARLFAPEGEDGAEVDVNDMEAVITAVRVKFGLYTDSYLSAKGNNPESGSTVAGASALVDLSDVDISNPQDGQILSWNGTKWVNADAPSAGLDEAALAEYLTTNHYAKTTDIPSLEGYATQTWASGQFALKTVAINAGTGLTGGGTLAASRTLSLATVGTAGTYTKVTVDAYGRVTGHASLAAGDIPALAISKITGLQAALDAKMDAADKSDFMRYVDTVTADGDTLYSAIGIRSFSGCYPDSLPAGMRWYNYGEAISFPVPNGMRFDLYANHHSSSSLSTYNRNGLMFRTGFHNNTINGWRMILDSTNYNGYVTTLDNLTHAVASDYIQVGSARLRYDSANNALYVQKSDGTQCGFYATGFISTKGANSDAGSAVAGVTELTELEDVTISSPVNGQALVYRNGVWKNETIETGMTSVAWGDVTGKPSSLANDQYYYGHGKLTTDFNDAVKGGAYYTNSEAWPSNGPGTSYKFGALAVFHTGTDNMLVAQLWMSHDASSAGGVYVRMKYESSDGDWRAWRRLLDDACITDYTVTKTGGGASGTWGIGISGNAATATRLQTARTLWGQSFNGTENVSGDMTGVGNISASGTVYANAFRLNNSKGRFFYDEPTNAVWLQGGAGLNMSISNYTGGTIPTLTVHADVMHVAGGMYADEYLQVGSARLRWDSATGALYVQKSDGTQCGFYATGFVSAKGANADAGSAVAGATELSELDDVAISSPVNGQALVYRNGVWKNETVSGGGSSSVAWADVTGKPSWIPDTDGSGSGIDADLLDGTHKSGLFTAMTYQGSTLSLTIGGVRKTVNIETSAVIPTVSVSSTSSRNLSVNVGGSTDYVNDLYATYLGGTTKQGLFTGLTYSSNKLSVTVGGTTRSVTINAGGDETDHFMSRGRVYDLDAVNQSGVAYVNNPSNLPDGAYQWGFVATFLSSEGGTFGFQIYVGDGTGRGIYVRTRYDSAWKGWNKYMPAS